MDRLVFFLTIVELLCYIGEIGHTQASILSAGLQASSSNPQARELDGNKERAAEIASRNK